MTRMTNRPRNSICRVPTRASERTATTYPSERRIIGQSADRRTPWNLKCDVPRHRRRHCRHQRRNRSRIPWRIGGTRLRRTAIAEDRASTPGTWGLGLIGPESDTDEADLIASILRVGCGVADERLVETFVRGIHPSIVWLEDELGVRLNVRKAPKAPLNQPLYPASTINTVCGVASHERSSRPPQSARSRNSA